MPKFIITWNCGFGDCAEVIEAADKDAALDAAHERCVRDDIDKAWEIDALPYDAETAEALGAE